MIIGVSVDFPDIIAGGSLKSSPS